MRAAFIMEERDPDSSTILLQNGSKQTIIHKNHNSEELLPTTCPMSEYRNLQAQFKKLQCFFLGLVTIVIIGGLVLIGAVVAVYVVLMGEVKSHTHKPKVAEQMAKILDIEPICISCSDIRLGPSPQEDRMLDQLLRRGSDCCAETPNQLMQMLNLTIERRYREEIARGNIQMPMARTVYPNSGVRRPVAHLLGSSGPRNVRKILDNMYLVDDWISDMDLAYTQNIMYRNGRLVVPENGHYFVYSQVSFFELYDIRTSESRIRLQTMESPSISHYIYRYNIIYEEGGEELLAQNSATKCQDSRRQFGEYSSYIGAAFTLRQGDEIFVKVSNLTLMSTDHKLNNFGIFKL